ncbi:hypothetical protein F7725_023801 [Dissostichus mawsoni]|uniref:Uncharacterized protein n=1 Tax=Dissostichus mawsoni TaxID=36200 RepID=A0A7J5XXQ0_DISMA|nr:hypothetical protein F7725_023801 [Dissostichus mawsoni]
MVRFEPQFFPSLAYEGKWQPCHTRPSPRRYSWWQFISVKYTQIDSSVIALMSEEDLAKYIPHYGDRLAAVAFCRNSHCGDSVASRRGQLERIRAKCCLAFIDPDMMNRDVHIKRKLPNGELEEGEGSGGLRDCLTEFWGELYSKCTLGTNVKTSYLRHEYQVQESL